MAALRADAAHVRLLRQPLGFKRVYRDPSGPTSSAVLPRCVNKSLSIVECQTEGNGALIHWLRQHRCAPATVGRAGKIPKHQGVASYHFSVQIVRRSQGRSAIAMAAYRGRNGVRAKWGQS